MRRRLRQAQPLCKRSPPSPRCGPYQTCTVRRYGQLPHYEEYRHKLERMEQLEATSLLLSLTDGASSTGSSTGMGGFGGAAGALGSGGGMYGGAGAGQGSGRGVAGQGQGGGAVEGEGGSNSRAWADVEQVMKASSRSGGFNGFAGLIPGSGLQKPRSDGWD